MLKITIESHRFNDPAIEWVTDMLQFKQVPFRKRVCRRKEGVIRVEIEKREPAKPLPAAAK